MGAVVDDAGLTLLEGDCRELLPTLPEASVHCVVTSPPYWGLRDYGTATWEGGDPACDHRRPGTSTARTKVEGYADAFRNGTGRANHVEEPWPHGVCGQCGARRIDAQLGLEPTPEAYLATMVAVFRAVRRVLRDDGTLWMNMGDSYWNGGGEKRDGGHDFVDGGKPKLLAAKGALLQAASSTDLGLKPKDLVGMPWRLAFALQADGWYLRADIIWAKPNPMPESVTDRPTKAHEYVFLLSKKASYFYDADAVREPAEYGRVPSVGSMWNGIRRADHRDGRAGGTHAMRNDLADPTAGRNCRSVWTIPSAPFPDAHFATFPPALASRCIQAGSSEKGCCAACGAPWARQVERTGGPPNNRFRDGLAGDCKTAHDHGTVAGAALSRLYAKHGYPTVTTTGWAPPCACAAPVTPCTVLDPFAGSGTTGQVAQALGRRALLIELSAPYVQLARTRTAQRGLFTEAAARP